MALIPLLRTIIFSFASVLSLGVLGICAHILWLTQGYTNSYLAFAPFGTASSCITVVSLPLFLILGRSKRRIFTSAVIFEIVWFLVLWVLWVATAGTTVAAKSFFYPDGCFGVSVCIEVTVMEALAFLNFFAIFIYYDVLFLYAIICAIRGRSIWTISVMEAAARDSGNPAVPMNQAQYPQQFTPQYPQYTGPQNVGPVPAAYPPGAPPQPFNAYQQQPPPPQGPPYTNYPGTAQGNYTGSPQQANYNYTPNAPSAGSTPPPPQPNYGSYPGSYAAQGQPQPPPTEYQQQPPYGVHQAA
ncbi:hypothetical protein ID866_7307 [Astraeus odoratus]|nr:hypothetical protein ID866_7307 [Astraeus odoratus]